MSDIAQELIEQIAKARQDKQPLKIIGGGSKTGILSRDIEGTALDISRHQGIVSYDRTELVLTARAGTRLTDIEAILEEQDQILPFEPPHFGSKATIGGTLACNLSGPARPFAGSIRDMALGSRLINGRAEHLRFGGQVMKNVAGYDVTRLQAGALGSLGIITEVSLKVMPKPERTQSLCFELSEQSAIERMSDITGSVHPITGAAYIDNQLFIRLGGSEKGVGAACQTLGGEKLPATNMFWRDLREQKLDFFAGNAPVWRFAVRAPAPPIPDRGPMLLDWGGGQRWLRGEHDFAVLQQMAEKAGGHVTMFKGGKRREEVRSKLSSVQKDLHIRLKRAFDPDRIINPGRLYGWM